MSIMDLDNPIGVAKNDSQTSEDTTQNFKFRRCQRKLMLKRKREGEHLKMTGLSMSENMESTNLGDEDIRLDVYNKLDILRQNYI